MSVDFETAKHQALRACAAQHRPTGDLAIGRRAWMARRASGWSQRQLADAMTRLGYPWQQQTVAKVERGDRPLRLSEAMVMASVLGVPVDVLCSDRDDRSTAALSAPSALDLAQQLVRVLRDEGE